jgi:phosphonate transport system substrate-binding protein
MDIRPLYRAAAAVTAVLAVSLSAAACGGGSTGDAAASTTCPDGRIRFGVEPFEDPAKLVPAYQAVADALEKTLDCPVEVSIVEDYSAEVLAMQNGQLELAQFGPLGYVFAEQKANAEAIASFGTADGALSTYTAGVWVPRGSDVVDVTDLAGRTLALGSIGSTSGDALPRQALADAGVAESDLRVEYAGGHPEALLALVNGKVDAAQINSQTLATAVAEGTFDPTRYTQVWTSDPIPNDPITVRGDLDPAFKQAVTDALLNLPAETVGQVGAYLDVTPPGPMVAVTQDTYRPLFDLASKLGLTEDDV